MALLLWHIMECDAALEAAGGHEHHIVSLSTAMQRQGKAFEHRAERASHDIGQHGS